MTFTDVDEYLAGLPQDQRVALEALRRVIRSADPSATETISYKIPTFKHAGKHLIYFGAAKAHCAIYGMPIDGFSEELKGYSTSKGTIRFQTDKPLPADLVTRMIHARIAEIEAKG